MMQKKGAKDGISSKLVIGLVAVAIVAVALYSVLRDGEEKKPVLIQTGSSTVLPLALAWAEEFDEADISVSGGGSSHGLNALLLGEADLADASRLLKPKDYEKVGGDPSLVNPDGTASGPAPSGIWPEKWVVAYDVLVVVVNTENDWVNSLNFTQLYKIFTDDDPAVYWDEVPGLEDAPHEKIEIYAPDEASGTYDFFFESIIPNWGKENQQANPRLESGDGVYHPSADDNVILNAIRSNKYSIGYFGFAYYKENPDVVKPVAIARGSEEPVQPSLDAVARYPLSRPLHIYTNKLELIEGKKRAIIVDYLRYILSEEGQAIVPEVGYVPVKDADPSVYQAQISRLNSVKL